MPIFRRDRFLAAQTHSQPIRHSATFSVQFFSSCLVGLSCFSIEYITVSTAIFQKNGEKATKYPFFLFQLCILNHQPYSGYFSVLKVKLVDKPHLEEEEKEKGVRLYFPIFSAALLTLNVQQAITLHRCSLAVIATLHLIFRLGLQKNIPIEKHVLKTLFLRMTRAKRFEQQLVTAGYFLTKEKKLLFCFAQLNISHFFRFFPHRIQ